MLIDGYLVGDCSIVKQQSIGMHVSLLGYLKYD